MDQVRMLTTEELALALKIFMGASAIIAVLLGCVLWFLKRLIVKVDKIDVLEVQVNAMVKEMKDMGHLRERVAVLEALGKDRRRAKLGPEAS